MSFKGSFAKETYNFKEPTNRSTSRLMRQVSSWNRFQWNYRSLLLKNPIKETIFCKRDLWSICDFMKSQWDTRELRQSHCESTIVIAILVSSWFHSVSSWSQSPPHDWSVNRLRTDEAISEITTVESWWDDEWNHYSEIMMGQWVKSRSWFHYVSSHSEITMRQSEITMGPMTYCLI